MNDALLIADARCDVQAYACLIGIMASGSGHHEESVFSPALIDWFRSRNSTALLGLFTFTEATMTFGAPICLNLPVGATSGCAVPLMPLGVVTVVGAVHFHWGTAPNGVAQWRRAASVRYGSDPAA